MTPLQTEHLKVIQAEVIPMTDESNAKEHADISVRFAIEVLKEVWVNPSLFILNEIERLEKML